MRGHIDSRGKGTWRIRWEAPRGADGRRRYRGETIHGTKKEAEGVLRDRLREQERGGYVEPSRETLSEYMERWLQTYAASNCAPRTVQGYRQYVRCYVNPSIGGVRLQALQPTHVQGLYADLLKRGLSSTTVVQLHRIIHEALAHAVKWELCLRNITDAVSPPKIVRKEAPVWDDEIVGRFLDVSKSTRYDGFFRLALLTGMRRGELAGLRWSNVDLVSGRILVLETRGWLTGQGIVTGKPKTARSARSIVLDDDAVELLHNIKGRQILGGNQSEYVLTAPEGGPVDPNEASHAFHKLVKKARLPHLTLHGLRHVQATRLLQRGVNPKIVSERLGHSTVSITLDVYSHVLPGLQESAIRDLGRIFDLR